MTAKPATERAEQERDARRTLPRSSPAPWGAGPWNNGFDPDAAHEAAQP